jgi:hypothetical protein
MRFAGVKEWFGEAGLHVNIIGNITINVVILSTILGRVSQVV